MFKTLLKQEAMKQSAEPREGDLYREVEVFGKVFDLRYGYYEEKDRRGPPDIIYPNFIKEPVYTQDGKPFVTMMQDACQYYSGDIDSGGDSICGDCKYFKHGEEWLGVCTCSKKQLQV
ncbi:MAG: hypothetical protein J6V22_04950 [Clostridia bacterium]|nr:hypothetical protein [Clostridia bacterium]